MASMPPSGFTFSSGFLSSLAPTPSSSSRDSSEEGSSASTTQSLGATLLFQDLSLSDAAGSMLTPRARSPTAWLSPGSSPSTYAQQHNASPSPRPKLKAFSRRSRKSGRTQSTFSSTSQASVYFDARETRPELIFSDHSTDRIHIPGAFPTQDDHSESHAAGCVEMECEGGSASNQYSDLAGPSETRTTDICEELLPGAPVYRNRLQTGLKEVKVQLARLARTIGISDLKKDQSPDLYELHERTKRYSMFEYAKTRTVGFIGASGVGKSSLINSLLDQQSLSRSSSDGAACTCVVTEFRHVDKNHTGPFTIEAQFMTAQEMSELLDELLSNFRQFHVTSLNQALEPGEEKQKCQSEAERAWETFQSLFNNQPRLTMEFLSVDYDGARSDILAQLERWAHAGLTLRPGGSDALDYSTISGDLKECQDSLDLLTANKMGNGRPALWPFIKLIRVYLSSPILKNGLILADLPGLSDLNFARVRATERYLAHSCDEVFVVVDIARVCTDLSIQDIMRRCRNGQPRRIICTKSEAISPEEAARGDSPAALKVKQMNRDVQAVRKQLEETIWGMRKADGERLKTLNHELFQLDDREKELDFEIKKFLINRRNSEVSQELIQRYPNIKVFCISNTLYSNYRHGRGNQDSLVEAYINLTGIRELRRYCQLVPADALMRSASAFLDHKVPALLLSLNQWALSGKDSVMAEKAGSLRRVLENIQQALHQEFISSRGCVQLARQSLDDLFGECVYEVIQRSRDRWMTDSIETSLKWAGLAPGTYAAFCRKSGDYATPSEPRRCWNDELVRPVRGELNDKCNDILDWLEAQTGKLARETCVIFEKFHKEIKAHIHLAPYALKNLQKGMKSRQKCIENHIRESIQKIIQSFEYDVPEIDDCKLDSNKLARLLKRDMLHGHSSSFISVLMQPAYAAINREEGDRSHTRRTRIMNDHLEHSRIFTAFSREVHTEYTKIVTDCFDDLLKNLTEQVDSMGRDFQAVVTAEGQISEAEQAPALADALKSKVWKIHEILKSAQATVRELEAKE
ncbi:hypothetical protein BGW36DRAFT_364783 [Talaromyces proteolyticus]|uniref:Uncharacterized protein n=1 Tax=Talaromyces proteolyticus TaxID=1131652 RepID=A0AAD4KFP8_9EURO|nr:uncharacterized protein BGW36DRAFT_364783 [Talaromyces proteolyticus]KAH8690053.1 hypothetical protein BGW36DRAFT_364783 [Talaromyces proteolyticus]